MSGWVSLRVTLMQFHLDLPPLGTLDRNVSWTLAYLCGEELERWNLKGDWATSLSIILKRTPRGTPWENHLLTWLNRPHPGTHRGKENKKDLGTAGEGLPHGSRNIRERSREDRPKPNQLEEVHKWPMLPKEQRGLNILKQTDQICYYATLAERCCMS